MLKNAKTKDLIQAIHDVQEKGYHFSDLVSSRLVLNINMQNTASDNAAFNLNDRELEFLKHCCSEMTYKEIGNVMHVSPRTAEGYSKNLCEKLGVKSRVGLVLYAIKNKFVVL